MIFSSKQVAAMLLLAAAPTTDAFVTKSSSSSKLSNDVMNRQCGTSLNAMPPLIISPILRKMKEEKAKSRNGGNL